MSTLIANKWLDGRITTGKLLELLGVPRPSGDDLVGSIANAFCDRIEALQGDLAKEVAKCDTALSEANYEKWNDSVVAEAARKRVLLECSAKLQLHFGIICHRKNR